MQSKHHPNTVCASWERLSLWIGMPAMLNYARLAVLGCGGLAAVAGFVLVATLLSFLPFVMLGGLALIVTVVLIVSVSGFVSIGGTLYFLSRSSSSSQTRPSPTTTRASKTYTPFIGQPRDFNAASFQVLRSYAAY